MTVQGTILNDTLTEESTTLNNSLTVSGITTINNTVNIVVILNVSNINTTTESQLVIEDTIIQLGKGNTDSNKHGMLFTYNNSNSNKLFTLQR